MSDNRTTSILQRAPVILAVTAASYGLPLQGRGSHPGNAGRRDGQRHGGFAGAARRSAGRALNAAGGH